MLFYLKYNKTKYFHLIKKINILNKGIISPKKRHVIN